MRRARRVHRSRCAVSYMDEASIYTTTPRPNRSAFTLESHVLNSRGLSSDDSAPGKYLSATSSTCDAWTAGSTPA